MKDSSLVSFEQASILWSVFYIFQVFAIYLFKYLTIPEFKKEPIEHQVVHVLANTIAVIPFKTWDHEEPQESLAMTKEQIELEADRKVRRQSSLPSSMIPKKQNKLHSKSLDNLSLEQDYNEENCESQIQIDQEDQVQQLTEDIRDILIQIWWKDPSRELTVDNAKEELDHWISSTNSKLGKTGHTDIGNVVESLNEKGFINKKLYHPRCTKMEYFWLFFIQVIINVATLIIEIANTTTTKVNAEEDAGATKGMQYYTWDIRVVAFLMGLFFLGMYYKEHHKMKGVIKLRCCLRYCPIFFCTKREKPIEDIPNRIKLEEIFSKKTSDPTKPLFRFRRNRNQNPKVSGETETETIYYRNSF